MCGVFILARSPEIQNELFFLYTILYRIKDLLDNTDMIWNWLVLSNSDDVPLVVDVFALDYAVFQCRKSIGKWFDDGGNGFQTVLIVDGLEVWPLENKVNRVARRRFPLEN